MHVSNRQSIAPVLQQQRSWVTVWVCVKHYALQAESFFSTAADNSPVLLKETPFETTWLVGSNSIIVIKDFKALIHSLSYESPQEVTIHATHAGQISQ